MDLLLLPDPFPTASNYPGLPGSTSPGWLICRLNLHQLLPLTSYGASEINTVNSAVARKLH